MQLYETPLTINLPTITTAAATSVDETSAILHGLLTESGDEPCDIRFQYGLTTGYELGTTPWVSDFVTGNTSGFMITGATSGVTYHFRAQARNSQGTVDGLDSSLTCGPIGPGWTSPTGDSDATGRWENNPNIHDDELGSYGKCNHLSNDPNGQWGPYVYLLHSTLGIDSIRFIAKDDNNIDAAQVDVSVNGVTWFNVYDAAFVNQAWTIASFAPQYVSQVRVRFHVSSNDAGLYWELYELDLHVTEAVGVTRTWDGGAGTNNWGDAANWNPDGIPIPLDDLTLSGVNTIDVNVAGVCNNLTLNNASLVLTVKSGRSLTAYGNLTLTTGTLNTEAAFPTVGETVTISGGTVGYAAGGGSQTVAVESYANLTISGGGTKTLAGIITLSGNLSVNGGTFDLSTFTASRASVGGTLTIAAGAGLTIGATNTLPSNYSTHSIDAISTISYNGASQTVAALNSSQNYGHLALTGSGTKTLGASITVRGTLTLSGATLADGGFSLLANGNISNSASHSGAGRISLTGGSGSHMLSGGGSYGNLEMNDVNGATLSASLTVNGTLTLTSGNISTNANTLSISSTGAVSRTSGHVVGNLQKSLTTGSNMSRTLEIGDAINYAPVDVVFASVSVAGNLTAKTTSSDHPNIAGSDVNPANSVNRYWTLTQDTSLAFTNYNATFNFVGDEVDAGASTGNFIARRYSGGSWSSLTMGTRTATSTQIIGAAGFGDFQVGNVLSVAVGNGVFAFGAQPLNTWLPTQSSVITNDGTETEDVLANISTFTAGTSAWALSVASNGPDQVRAQWSATSASGPWEDIAAYDSAFTVATGLASSGTVTLYLRIQTPTSTSSFNQHSSVLTVTAQ